MGKKDSRETRQSPEERTRNKRPDTLEDSPYERLEKLARKVLSVPKEEVDRRERERKKRGS